MKTRDKDSVDGGAQSAEQPQQATAPALSFLSKREQQKILPFSSNVTICHSDPDCGSCSTRLAGSGLRPVTARGRNLLQVALINNKLLSAIKALHTGNPQPFSGVNNDTGTSTRHDQGCWLLEPGGAQAQR